MALLSLTGMDIVKDCTEWADREKWEETVDQGNGGGIGLGDWEMPVGANLVSLREIVYCLLETIDRYL